MTDNLLACPFCGGEASIIGIRDGRQVSCKGLPRTPCFAKGPAVYHGPGGWEACEAEAIAAWNTRIAASTPEAGLVEALLAALAKISPIETNNTPDYAEITFGEHQTQAMTMCPDDWNAIEAAYRAVLSAAPSSTDGQ